MHFINNQNTKTWIQVHGAYLAHYNFEPAETICDESSSFLGCIHFSILYFNATLVCHNKVDISKNHWDQRKEHFLLVANSFEKTYGTFGCTDAVTTSMAPLLTLPPPPLNLSHFIVFILKSFKSSGKINSFS